MTRVCWPCLTVIIIIVINFCEEINARPTSVAENTDEYDFIHEGGAFSSWINLLSLIQLQQSSVNEIEKGTKILYPHFCGKRPGMTKAGRRIVGGTEARSGEVPWHASLVKTSSDHGTYFNIRCGAALISSKAAVTAAHCLKLEPENYQVIVGKDTSRTIEECNQQTLKVVSYIKHPDFNPRTLKTDIAIINLESPYGQGAMFNRWVMPICLPQTTAFYKEGTDGLVSGFGLLSESGTSVSETLQVVSLSVFDQDSCEDSYSHLTRISSSQFCAGTRDVLAVRDACAGDSGGPMAVLHDGRWVLSGVVSFGMGCGRPEFPGVYTKVQPFVPWILENIPIDKEDTDEKDEDRHNENTSSSKQSSLYSVKGMCQGTERHIWCDHGSVIEVTDVFYGRRTTDSSTCSISTPTRYRYNCSLSSATSDLSSSCNGATRCRVSSDLFLTNPCPDLQPFVSFQFECRDLMGRSFTGGSRP